MLKKILSVLLMIYAAACFAAVDANKGNAAELDSIKGIGPAMSTRILDERKKSNFKDWPDFISRVKGVGEATAAKLSKEGLTINGAEFKAEPAKPAASAAKK
jgi:competence protein ComEA